MGTFTLTTTLARPYDDAVGAVRAALGEQGFGILTANDALRVVATDAKERLTAALAALTQED